MNFVSLSEADIKAAPELVKKIRSELPAFDYNPKPAGYDSTILTRKNKEILEDGAEYTGEWDNKGLKEGQGVKI